MAINRTMPKAYVIQIIGEGVTPPFDGQNFVMEPTQWEEVKKVVDEYYQTGEWFEISQGDVTDYIWDFERGALNG